ncbi:General transcription factor 3C polypeptide 5 [Linum grandiflorum]
MGVIEDGKVEGTLPSNEVFAVQYPGYPSSIPRAIQTLGGTKAITKARASKSNNLELHFRPEDPYSRPILGELCPCNGLLLKIVKTQPSSQNADNSPTTTADKGRSCLEAFELSVGYSGMADYQHVVAVHADVARRKKRNWTEMDKPLRPTSTASSKKKSEDVVENYMEVVFSFQFYLAALQIPKELNWKEFTPLNSVMHEWLMALSELFEERPIWPKESLVQRLREKDLHFNHQTLKRLLVLVAYYFLGGPYRMFWIQKGYDPRQDAESRMYQRMDLRVPPALRSYCDSHAAKGLKHKWEDLCKFEAFPYKCHISLQLFELVDDYIQEEIKKPSKQPTCTYGTGWFTQHAHDSLKFRVMARFLSVYPQPGAEKLHKAALRYFEKSKKQSALENYQKEAQPTDTDDNVGGNQHETGDIAIDELADDDDQEEEIDAYDALDLAGEDDEFSLHSDAFMEPDSNSRNYLQELFYTFPTTGPGAAKIHDADSSDGEYQILEQDDENYSDDDYE